MRSMTQKICFALTPGLLLAGAAFALEGQQVRLKLEEMLDRDEALLAQISEASRVYGANSGEVVDWQQRKAAIDQTNIVSLEEIVAASGWPVAAIVGEAAAAGAARAVMNADVSHQKRLLPVLLEQAQLFELDSSIVAVIEDRVLVSEGRPQKYGSQFQQSEESGARSYHPIADCQSVDLRRASVGLEPLARDAQRNSVEKYNCPEG